MAAAFLFCLFFNNISRFLMVLRFFVFHFQHGVSQSFMLRCVCPDTYRCCSRRIAGIFRNPMSCLYTVSIACLHTSTARIVSRKIMILPKDVSTTRIYPQQRFSLSLLLHIFIVSYIFFAKQLCQNHNSKRKTQIKGSRICRIQLAFPSANF